MGRGDSSLDEKHKVAFFGGNSHGYSDVSILRRRKCSTHS